MFRVSSFEFRVSSFEFRVSRLDGCVHACMRTRARARARFVGACVACVVALQVGFEEVDADAGEEVFWIFFFLFLSIFKKV